MTNQPILTHSFAAVNPSAWFLRSRAEDPRASTDASRVWSLAARTASSVKTSMHTARNWVQFWTTAL
ncbi:MAG: hypothetical protein RLZZ450_5230 [Pseudomonadota bacterium]|jgi:hypothetical protein